MPAEAAPAAAPELEVEVICCPARGQVDRSVVRLPDGSSVLDAVHASGVVVRLGLDPSSATGPLDVGIHGRRVDPQARLQAGDRVELYRPLRVTPGDARRERERGQRLARLAATARRASR